ncbi:MAG: hypothetical protein FJY85_14155 [Deltaproteobacteria bacterium]|nr:hypothetical protein [Deltaproteobacteria bacterium]
MEVDRSILGANGKAQYPYRGTHGKPKPSVPYYGKLEDPTIDSGNSQQVSQPKARWGWVDWFIFVLFIAVVLGGLLWWLWASVK